MLFAHHRLGQDMRSHESERERRTRDILVVLLALNSGATDAIGFLALGGAFTSVMTGNMVLLGIAGAKLDTTLAGHIGAAILCYVAGCAVGARVAGTPQPGDSIWPRAITRALAIEAAMIAVFAVGWWSCGGHPHGWEQLALLAVNAVALGLQSSSVQRFGVSGLSTTYLTGTLTTAVVRLASGHSPRQVLHSMQLLGGLIGGAALGALAFADTPTLVPLVQIGSLAMVLSAAVLRLSVRDPAARSNSATKVVVVGTGRLGSALIDRLPTCFDVVALSRRHGGVTHLGARNLPVTDDVGVVRGSSVVLLAIPAAATAEVLQNLAPHLDPNTIVVNMATEAMTPDLRRFAPNARIVAAKLIGQAAELANGSPGTVVIDSDSADESSTVRDVLGVLGRTITGPEQLVLDVNSVVAQELARAEHTIRTRLERLDLPRDVIDSTLTTMGVGILRAIATDTCEPFLQQFVDARAARL